MQKTILTIVLAALCLIFSNSASIYAQDNKAIDITTKGIQIGQKVPDVLLNNIHNYKATSTKLSDFKGKLVIIDFWATWCSPCLAMIPKMDSLQKTFGEKIQFLTVTYQNKEEVLPFLEKYEKQTNKHYNLPVLTSDKRFHNLFPHSTLPHYIWINSKGIVQAFTGFQEINSKNISKALSGNVSAIKQRKIQLIKYDNSKPLFVDNNGGDGTKILYKSLFSPFNAPLPSRFEVFPVDSAGNIRVTITNVTITRLFMLAYGEGVSKYIGPNRVLMNVRDTTRLTSSLIGQLYDEWMEKGNGYCYELIVSKSRGKDIWKFMQQDLDRFFDNYSASRENKMVKCLALVRTSKIDKIKSKGGLANTQFGHFGWKIKNTPLAALITRLNLSYLQKSPLPIIDLTAYTGPVDLDIQTNLTNVKKLNDALAKYDLALKEVMHETDMLEIKDRINL